MSVIEQVQGAMPDDISNTQSTKSNTPTEPPPVPVPTSIDPQLEFQLVQHVRELFLRAREKRRPLVAQWSKNYKLLTTSVKVTGQTTDWRPAPEVPEIWPVIDALVAWITDQKPTFDAVPVVSPQSPYFQQLSQLAGDLTDVVKSTWSVDKFDAEVEKVVWDAMTYNIGYFKTVWNGSAYRGYGNAVMRRVDPYTLYPDPDATSMETSNYFIEARTISLQEMERRWPGSIALTKQSAFTEDIDSSPTMLDQNNTTMPKANPGAIAPAVTPRYGLPGQDNRLSVTDDPGVTVFEAWLRTPIKNDNGKIYDSWRCVVVAGNRVLMDKMAEELWEHGQHPYDRFVCIETGEFYGRCMVEMLGPMQRSINRVLASIEHSIHLIGNPVLVEDTRAGLSRTQVTNKPGQRLQKNAGASLEWMMPPIPYPGMATDLVKFYIEQMERVSGLSAVVRGASPSGRNAQGVVDSVQEAAFVRIRKSLRNLSYSIGASGDKLASLICEYYTEPRLISLIGPDGQKSAIYLKSNHFYLPTDSGPTPMQFQLLIDSGEEASQSRGQRIAEIDALFAMGAVDEEAVLKVHAIPGWYNIVQRVREMKAQAGQLGQPPNQREAGRR